MKIHFIAIGGSVMHNLAIALFKKGFQVKGSDDEISEPSKSRLATYGLLPASNGWNPESIDSSTDAVILGMHAREDNPELIKAKQLAIKIYSYPEYIYEQTKNKTRIVVGGSHGKTTITSMIMHVLKENGFCFDYLVGSQLDGFETMVHLSDESKIAVFEGDEYLASPLDKRPKFHIYKPHIAVINGIEWDHINVFPTFEKYLEQFQIFTECIEKNGVLFYYDGDENVKKVIHSSNAYCRKIAYREHPVTIHDGISTIHHNEKTYRLNIFGSHNMQNIMAAKSVCDELGIESGKFYGAISTFKGAAKRLQLIHENKERKVFLDFAHAPSKVKASIKAVKEQFASYPLIACLELHTFSSLNISFLNQYKNSMNEADFPVVYYNPHTIAHKQLPEISHEKVLQSFENKNLHVFSSIADLEKHLYTICSGKFILLFMSSGNFGGMDLNKIIKAI